MKLSKKSWHFLLHRLVFGDDAKMPTNFCPYFWKSIVLGFIITIVFLPFAIPVIIIRALLLTFKAEDLPPSPFDKGLWSEYSAMTIFVDIALLCLFSMFAMWFIPFTQNKEGNDVLTLFHCAGAIGWLAVIAPCIHFITKHIKEKKREARYKRIKEYQQESKEEEPNILIEAVKSWYKRNCPIIEWKEENHENS